MKHPRILALMTVAALTLGAAGTGQASAKTDPTGGWLPGPNSSRDAATEQAVMAKGIATRKGATVSITNAEVQKSVRIQADVVKIAETGPVDKRLNLVFMGDGYTASQQEDFLRYARDKWSSLGKYEPFKSYQAAFNVYAVKVISNESGISHDPRGRKVDNAMGSQVYCGNIPELVCADVAKVKSYAKNAPKADQIVVLENTRLDVASGYPTEAIALVRGNGSDSNDALAHEMGHSVGALADEYTYPEGMDVDQWESPNVTNDRSGAKWKEHLGKPTPDGGKIGVFEGAAPGARGWYRPSENSLMRNLGRPFNLVGSEAIRKTIEKHAPDVRPGDPAKPVPTPTTKPTATSSPTKPAPQGGEIAVTDANLDEVIGKSRDQLVVFVVGANWSKRTQLILPKFRSKLAADGNSWTLAYVDGALYKQALQKFDVKGYPTVIGYAGGQEMTSPARFADGSRSREGVETFVDAAKAAWNKRG